MPIYRQAERLFVFRQLDCHALLLVRVRNLKTVLHELAYIQISLGTRLKICHVIAGYQLFRSFSLYLPRIFLTISVTQLKLVTDEYHRDGWILELKDTSDPVAYVQERVTIC